MHFADSIHRQANVPLLDSPGRPKRARELIALLDALGMDGLLEFNERYWAAEQARPVIAATLGALPVQFSRWLVIPAPAGLDCPDCGEDVLWRNRSDRLSGQWWCTNCGLNRYSHRSREQDRQMAAAAAAAAAVAVEEPIDAGWDYVPVITNEDAGDWTWPAFAEGYLMWLPDVDLAALVSAANAILDGRRDIAHHLRTSHALRQG